MTTVHRIKQISDNEDIKITELEKIIGASKGVLSRAIKNNTDIQSKWLSSLVENYPDYNPTWLLTGRGSMLKKKQYPTKGKGSGKVSKGPITYHTNNKKGIPLIPLDAMAGWGTGDVQVMEYEAQRYIVPEFEESKADFMIKVKGDSMSPTYVNGDIVACKKLLMETFFQWNNVYALDTIQGAMIKRIKKSSLEDHIKCISDNVDYDCFELHLQEMRSLAIVLGIIRFIN